MRARWIAYCIMTVLAFSAAQKPASAGLDSPTPPGLTYLMEEPVTLMDLGFLRLRMDLQRAAVDLIDPEYQDVPPKAGVLYNWRNDKIGGYVTFAVAVERRTATACFERFAHLQRSLLGGTPDGPDRARSYLGRIFSHSGPRRWYAQRPRSLEADLSTAFSLSVTLTGSSLDQRTGDLYTIQCSGPLDAVAGELGIRESGA